MIRQSIIRTYDIVLGLIIFIVFSIPLLILSICKLIFDGNPLFFNSKRVGLNGKVFTVYKFRTMVNDHKFIKNYLTTIHNGGFEKIPLDAIVYTKMGRFFERFQIVELMQLFNVLRGNMSIIGYRPLPQSLVVQLEEELGNKMISFRHAVLPGITGISQIVGKRVLTNKERVKVENSYNRFLQSSSAGKIILINTLIIVETFIQIMFGKHPFVNYLKKELHIIRFPGFHQSENDNLYYLKTKKYKNIFSKVLSNFKEMK